MKVWEEYAERHKKVLLKKAEDSHEVWKKFAETGDCNRLPIGCENCPFCNYESNCVDSQDMHHEFLNKEIKE